LIYLGESGPIFPLPFAFSFVGLFYEEKALLRKTGFKMTLHFMGRIYLRGDVHTSLTSSLDFALKLSPQTKETLCSVFIANFG
jgi:hypothetical protein